MLSKIVGVGFCGLSVLLLYRGHYVIGATCLVLALASLFGPRLEPLWKAVKDATKHSQLVERRCNCVLHLTLNVREVLNHEVVSDLLPKLQKKGLVSMELDSKEWCDQINERYQEKYKSDAAEEIAFNIKGSHLWKNGELDFTDTIWHELFIPYDLTKTDGDAWQLKQTDVGITIRVLVVNCNSHDLI